MPRASKIVKCVDCKKEFPRKQLNRKFRCMDCRSQALRDNMVQLHQHQGPAYDKWREAMENVVGRL